MRVVSINVGLPREIESPGRACPYVDFKSPVTGSVPARCLNIDGDRQRDLSAYGEDLRLAIRAWVAVDRLATRQCPMPRRRCEQPGAHHARLRRSA